MQVAIIGTGNVGKALGTSLVRAGHQVTFAAQDSDKTDRVAAEIGATATPEPAAAVRTADVVVLAIPYGSVEALAAEIREAAVGKVIVDTTNPLKADYSGLATAGGPSGAELLAALLPGAKVAKAFNTLFAAVQLDPNAHGAPADVLFATDDENARALLVELIDSMGFRPVDAGSLAAAGQLEALAWLNISMQMRFGGDWRTAFVLVGAPAAALAA